MKVHPLAELFPLMEGKEFEELVEDIRNNGLRHPILIDKQGRILDGRNRYRACLAAGVEPRFESWDGDESHVLDLILSLNVHRRHLNESQRALVAAKLKETWALDKSGLDLAPGKLADKAAAAMNVSPASVKLAARVLRSGNAGLIRAVEAGQKTVWAAAAGQRRRPPKPAPAADDAIVALWTAPDQIEEAKKLIDEQGLDYCAVILIAARRQA